MKGNSDVEKSRAPSGVNLLNPVLIDNIDLACLRDHAGECLCLCGRAGTIKDCNFQGGSGLPVYVLSCFMKCLTNGACL